MYYNILDTLIFREIKVFSDINKIGPVVKQYDRFISGQ